MSLCLCLPTGMEGGGTPKCNTLEQCSLPAPSTHKPINEKHRITGERVLGARRKPKMLTVWGSLMTVLRNAALKKIQYNFLLWALGGALWVIYICMLSATHHVGSCHGLHITYNLLSNVHVTLGLLFL